MRKSAERAWRLFDDHFFLAATIIILTVSTAEMSNNNAWMGELMIIIQHHTCKQTNTASTLWL